MLERGVLELSLHVWGVGGVSILGSPSLTTLPGPGMIQCSTRSRSFIQPLWTILHLVNGMARLEAHLLTYQVEHALVNDVIDQRSVPLQGQTDLDLLLDFIRLQMFRGRSLELLT